MSEKSYRSLPPTGNAMDLFITQVIDFLTSGEGSVTLTDVDGNVVSVRTLNDIIADMASQSTILGLADRVDEVEEEAGVATTAANNASAASVAATGIATSAISIATGAASAAAVATGQAASAVSLASSAVALSNTATGLSKSALDQAAAASGYAQAAAISASGSLSTASSALSMAVAATGVANTAQIAATAASSTAGNALAQSTSAVNTATGAVSTANAASTAAATATGVAATAGNVAAGAATAAASATGVAGTANTTANAAIAASATATGLATTANTAATSAVNAATGAVATANAASTAAAVATGQAAGAVSAANAATGQIQTAVNAAAAATVAASGALSVAVTASGLAASALSIIASGGVGGGGGIAKPVNGTAVLQYPGGAFYSSSADGTVPSIGTIATGGAYAQQLVDTSGNVIQYTDQAGNLHLVGGGGVLYTKRLAQFGVQAPGVGQIMTILGASDQIARWRQVLNADGTLTYQGLNSAGGIAAGTGTITFSTSGDVTANSLSSSGGVSALGNVNASGFVQAASGLNVGAGGTSNVAGGFTVNGNGGTFSAGPLASGAGSSVTPFTLYAYDGNADQLKGAIVRTAAGAGWGSAAWRLWRSVDSSAGGYIQFGLPTATLSADQISGMAFGAVNTQHTAVDGSGNWAMTGFVASTRATYNPATPALAAIQAKGNFGGGIAIFDGAYSIQQYSTGGDLYYGFSANSGALVNGGFGILRQTGEWVGQSANNFRIAYGSYGTFWRQDGSTLYLMRTAAGGALAGTWDGSRPIVWGMTGDSISSSSGWTFNGSVNGTATIMATNASIGSISNGGNGGNYGLVAHSGSGPVPVITFIRDGVYGVYLGIETDSTLRIGGWSMGNASYRILRDYIDSPQVNSAIYINSDDRLKKDFKKKPPRPLWRVLTLETWTYLGTKERNEAAGTQGIGTRASIVEKYAKEYCIEDKEVPIALRLGGSNEQVEEARKRIAAGLEKGTRSINKEGMAYEMCLALGELVDDLLATRKEMQATQDLLIKRLDALEAKKSGWRSWFHK